MNPTDPPTPWEQPPDPRGKNNGGPASLVVIVAGGNPSNADLLNMKRQLERLASGISVRDYFAARAIPYVAEIVGVNWLNADLLAERCYEVADAFLAERAKP